MSSSVLQTFLGSIVLIALGFYLITSSAYGTFSYDAGIAFVVIGIVFGAVFLMKR